MIKISKTKEEFIRNRNIVEEVILLLKEKVRHNQSHIKEIKKEGISVVEFSLDKNDLKRLYEEAKRFSNAIGIVEKLRGFMEDWYLRVKGEK